MALALATSVHPVGHATIKAWTCWQIPARPYPYGDDLSYRYVQVTVGGYDFRVFYIDPSVRVGQEVTADTAIGLVQDLGLRYPGIPNHVHFEIKSGGGYLDPTPTLIAMGG